MNTPTDHPPRLDPDGVEVSANPRTRRAFGVRAILAVAAVVIALFLMRPGPASRPAPQLAAHAGPPPQGAAPRPVKVLPQARPEPPVADGGAQPGNEAPAPRASAPVVRAAPAPEEPAAATEKEKGMVSALIRDVAEGLRVGGGKEGIGVYPPKGTNPPKPGIIVPDDFQLPEGYVRYHQITDDGRRLPPILMFSPDYDFVDADGKPVALPESGIVPPEMAPPGLPTTMLEIPGDDGTPAR